jgi:hypothetical protein
MIVHARTDLLQLCHRLGLLVRILIHLNRTSERKWIVLPFRWTVTTYFGASTRSPNFENSLGRYAVAEEHYFVDAAGSRPFVYRQYRTAFGRD